MDSFLTLRDCGDDLGFFKQILESAQQKADLACYGDRRSEEIQRNDMEVSLEGKSSSFKLSSEILTDLAAFLRGTWWSNGWNSWQGKGLQATTWCDIIFIWAQLRPC